MATAAPQLEYLFEDGLSVFKGIPFGTRLCYGSGVGYLAGLTVGSIYGYANGLSDPKGITRRLRLNCIVNSCANYGPMTANSVGMLALFYNLLHGSLIYLRKGKEDAAGSGLAAFTAGLLFKASSGPRTAAITASIIGSCVYAAKSLRAYWQMANSDI